MHYMTSWSLKLKPQSLDGWTRQTVTLDAYLSSLTDDSSESSRIPACSRGWHGGGLRCYHPDDYINHKLSRSVD